MRLAFSVAALLMSLSAAAQPRSVHLEDLTWPEVRAAAQARQSIAIYYAGSTEQNGPHMALGKHNFVARYVAERIARELENAVVYPVLPFAPTGDPMQKTEHMRYPGSISVSEDTFAAVCRDVALSAISAGFKNVALMGDHGGGQKALQRVAEALDARWTAKGTRVLYIGDVYFRTEEDIRALLLSRGMVMGAHAGISDTSELMFIDKDGRWVRKEELARVSAASGVDGDPRPASAELGKQILDIKVRNAVRQIRALVH